MSRQPLSLAMAVALVSCGGSPTSPNGGSSIESLLNSATADIKVNGATVQAGSTTTVSVGATLDYRLSYTNASGQELHTALVAVRDDGLERFLTCGATGSGGGGGGFGTSSTIFPSDPIYTPGRTVRVLLLGALARGSSGPGQCLLLTAQGQINRAAVQSERLLVTLVVQ